MLRRGRLGARKHSRIDFKRPAFVILEQNGPWIECRVGDISEGGAGLTVGAIALPKTFVLILTPDGKVRRICRLVWRHGESAGVRFISRKELLSTPTPSAGS
jgi:hypothetical protein